MSALFCSKKFRKPKTCSPKENLYDYMICLQLQDLERKGY